MSALLNQAIVLRKLGRLETALNYIEHALTIDPQNFKLWVVRALILWELKRVEEALQSLDRALLLHLNHPKVWQYRGTILDSIQRHDEAIGSYIRALMIEPYDSEGWVSLGSALQNAGRYDEAIVSYDKALGIEPDDAGVFYYGACCYAMQNNSEWALEHLRRAIALAPGYREIASNDSAFEKLRQDLRFQALIHSRSVASVMTGAN